MEYNDVTLGYKDTPSTTRNFKIPLSARKLLSKNSKKGTSISGRSTQSTVMICKTPFHTIESYGSPIPVQVTEALTFSDRNAVCSASINNEGWAWFVIGRRLLIWQAVSKNSLTPTCRELTLPPSDLSYSAELISIFAVHNNQNVSCVAVSPDGVIRYWPNISNEGTSIECSANTQGQECQTIKQISPIGFIVATSSAMLSLVETINIGGRHTITCRPLSVPTGWLGGISRKFSSMFFGGMNTSGNVSLKLIGFEITVNELSTLTDDAFSYSIFVMAGCSLQKWCICVGETEKLLYQCDLEAIIYENLEQTIWRTAEDNVRTIHIIDMKILDPSIPSIVALVVAYSDDVNPRMHYSLVIFNVDGDTPPTTLTSFHLLSNIDFSIFQPNNANQKISLLVSGYCVYMYNHRYIVSTPAISGCDDPDVIHLPETLFLGGFTVNRLPVFYSRLHGFISVSPTDTISPVDFVNNSTLNMDDSSIAQDSTMEESTFEGVTRDSCMKAAFLDFVSKKVSKAKTIINEFFPFEDTPPQVDATLDLVAIKVSKDLIDDIPMKDPRWTDIDYNEKIGMSILSLQIQNQLEDKQRVIDWFLSFLKEMGLWNRLGAVTWNNVTMPTTYIFAEQAEKLIAALVFKKLQAKYPQLLEGIIKAVVQNMEKIGGNGLTPYDLFYRKVSDVHKGIIQLCDSCEETVCTEQSAQNVIKNIEDTNTILQTLFEEITLFRKEKAAVFVPYRPQMSNFNTEMLWWTAAIRPYGLKDSLILQSKLTLKYGVKCANVLSQRQELVNNLIFLNSTILEGWKTHVESISKSSSVRHELLLNQYEEERTSLIQPLMELGEYESAMSLAEKYLDFSILVQICDKNDDDERLWYYMDKYEKKDFAQFLFSWYIREKQPSKLLSGQFRTNAKHQLALTKFLMDRPSIAWLHTAFCGNYDLAAKLILGLALAEVESLKRKKYMLTIGKLALLTAGNNDVEMMENVNREIELVTYQEDLPEGVLSAFDVDFETTKVFQASELIRFYICEENVNANEYDFTKAIELLNFVDDESEKDELKNEIWTKAILRDIWTVDEKEIGGDPVEFLRPFLVFKIIDLTTNLNIAPMLVPIEQLLSLGNLGELTENKTFLFLINVMYEFASRK